MSIDLHLPSRPILQRFREVVGLDGVAAVEVGDGAGELEDAVKGAGAELELRHRRLDQRLPRLVELAVLAHLGRSHVGVGLFQQVAVALRRESILRQGLRQAVALDGVGGLDAGADGAAGFAEAVGEELVVVDAGDVDVDVDAVEEGAGDALLVASDGSRTTGAFFLRVIGPTARAGILAIYASVCALTCLTVFSSL